jgi:thymidylate synthase (FAD)
MRKESWMKVATIEVTLLNHMGSDLSVVDAARVSFAKESHWDFEFEDGLSYRKLPEKDVKLIKYLADHEHKSPFNHCFASFHVKAPIFVARQLVKHKFLPWNEMSRRYVDDEPEFFLPENDQYRTRADNVKQGSAEKTICIPWIANITEDCLEAYQASIDAGVCPEQARMVLPQNTMTEWIWSGSLGAFADMCKLRLDSHSQKETREVAKQVAQSLSNLFPVSFKALVKESYE